MFPDAYRVELIPSDSDSDSRHHTRRIGEIGKERTTRNCNRGA